MEPKFPDCFKTETKPHKFCPGCGYGVILKNVGFAIDEMTLAKEVVFLTDIGCNLLAWDFFDLPSSQTHHGRTVVTAKGYKMADPDKILICLIGDGGGYAIGLQNLIHSCLRNDSLTIILVNNTNYGMTGGQMAPTTMVGQVTDSTPEGRDVKHFGQVFLGPELLKTIASPQAFIARTSSENPLQIREFVKKALENQKSGNFSFVEIISACPLNWRTNAAETIEKMKEREKIFKLGEIK